jgi:hypothetical protein
MCSHCCRCAQVRDDDDTRQYGGLIAAWTDTAVKLYTPNRVNNNLSGRLLPMAQLGTVNTATSQVRRP